MVKHIEGIKTSRAVAHKKPPVEIERRFLVDIKDVPSFEQCDMSYIEQGYLEGLERIRIRWERCARRDTYTKTFKSGSGISRTEIESLITRATYMRLEKHTACTLEKSRYFIPLADGHIAELNIFHGKLHGYVQLEVEFKTLKAAEAFVPDPWFGLEVTDDFQHTNYNLARSGLPKT